VRIDRFCRGQILWLVVSSIVVLLGFSGVAVDVGLIWNTRLKMQSAADAAALAGADALLNGSTDYTDPADSASTQNGFTNGSTTPGNSNTVTVTVSNPPSSGAHTSDNSAVQVVISQPQPTYFLKVLGLNSIAESVSSVATALSGQGCVYALDRSASQAFLTNSGTFTSSCGIMVDSNNSTAFNVNSGGSVTAAAIGVVGGTLDQGTVSPNPVTGIASFSDPFASLPAPTAPTAVSTCSPVQPSQNFNSAGTYTLAHGCYSTMNFNSSGAIVNLNDGGNYQFPNGLSTQGTVNLNGAGSYYFGSTVNINSGTFNAGGSGSYYFNSGLNIDSGVTATTGLAYFGGTVNFNGNGIWNLSSNGTYYFNSGLTDDSGGTIQSKTSGGTGTNNMLYFNGGTITVNSSAILNLTAPTSGTYAAVLMFQNRTNSTAVNIDAGSSVTLNGGLYFPDASITLNGGWANVYSFVIADKIDINGGTFNINSNYSSLTDGSPIKRSAVVE
jgi:putative Flp pilus-assembly TadE/G-like protein